MTVDREGDQGEQPRGARGPGETPDPPSILIVEDDDIVSRTLSSILERNGYSTEVVGAGKPALARAEARFYNVILLDIRLPDMEGLELLRPLRARHPEACVIMLTAHASTDSAIRALNEAWWRELNAHSVRDQVSLPFVCWQAGIRWHEIPGRCWVHNQHPHFYYVKHKA